MPFPNFAGKHAEDAFFSPTDLIAYLGRSGRLPDIPAVGGLILTYQPALLNAVVAQPGVRRVEHGFGGTTLLIPAEAPDRLPVLLVGGFGIGAPMVTVILEEWIALGLERVVSIGTAGGLQSDLPIGAITLVDRAIRDEVVSHHYLPGDVEARPDPALSAQLGEELGRLGGTPRVGRRGRSTHRTGRRSPSCVATRRRGC